jgi:hypothetical protein
MIAEIIKYPKVDYETAEKLANDVVKMVATQPGMTYGTAYNILKSHVKVYEEALSHLEHNARMEKKDDIIVYSMG